MKYTVLFIVLAIGFVFTAQPVLSATVTCEVQEVQGNKIVLINCNEQRLKGFKAGNKVKLKLKKK